MSKYLLALVPLSLSVFPYVYKYKIDIFQCFKEWVPSFLEEAIANFKLSEFPSDKNAHLATIEVMDSPNETAEPDARPLATVAESSARN